jgi:membrane-associated phospholipid phosphatase
VPRLRSSEWLLLAYFAYVALISAFFISPWRPWVVAVAVAILVLRLARSESWFRDLSPLPLVLIAFHEMDWFTPPIRDHHLEQTWIVWDRLLLEHHGLRGMIESAGLLLPLFFELCYLLVYAVGFVAVWVLLAHDRRSRLNTFWLIYLGGTLGAYALFPYFPSEPPRIVFAGADLPSVVTVLRRFNLWILGSFSIHSSVFPSAHVSSAFSAAWGLLATLPHRRWIGWAMAMYGLCVAIATVYGRYHYAVDVLAGAALSFIGPVLAYLLAYRKSRGA